MHFGTKATALPDLTANLLRDGDCLVESLMPTFGRNRA